MYDQYVSPLLQSKLEPLLTVIARKGVMEVCANNPGSLHLDVLGKGWEEIKTPWVTEEWVKDCCNFLANELDLPWSEEKPTLACQLPGGHRTIWGVGQNFQSHGQSRLMLVVRVKRPFKATFKDFGLDDDHAWAMRIRKAFAEGEAVLISGGTNSGKTTLLNMCLHFIPLDRRLVITEDVPELEPPQPNLLRILVSRLVAKTGFNYADGINILTRATPEVAGVGEISVDNTAAYIRIANSGHDSSFATVHANTPWDALIAMKDNVAMSGADSTGVLAKLTRVVDLVVQVKSVREGVNHVRRITDVVEPHEIPEVRAAGMELWRM